jgi:DNA uptake protein ComE-like DNA-binding protein
MKQFIRDYFTFNRRERNGVFILLSIILLLILYLSFSGYFFSNEKIDFSKFEKEIADFEAQQKRIEDSIALARASGYSDTGAYENTWSRPDRRSAYPKKPQYQKTFSSPKRKAEAGIIELNSADTAALKSLKGIGSVFAKRIIKFRDVLGGFVRKEQLLEVYGFDEEKFKAISPEVEVDLSKVKRININTASVEDLRKHPYMDKSAAVRIFRQRVNQGDYSEVKDILKYSLVDEPLFSKLAPYLITE